MDYRENQELLEALAILLEDAGMQVRWMTWSFIKGGRYSLNAQKVIRSCRRGEVVILHFGRYLPVGRARLIVHALRKKGVKTIAMTAGRPGVFGTDAAFQKPEEPSYIVHLIRLVARKK